MIRRTGGQFRAVTYEGIAGVCCGDNTGSGAGSTYATWTTGATLIDSGGLQPPALARWKVLAVSIQAGLYCLIFPGSGSAAGYWGTLSPIRAGIVPQPPTTGALGGAVPFNQPMAAEPADQSLVGPLWDPAVNPMCPIINAGVGGSGQPAAGVQPLPISTSLVLPQPLEVTSGGQVNVGIWLHPMRLKSTLFLVMNGQFAITYDDGASEPQPSYGGMRPPAP